MPASFSWPVPFVQISCTRPLLCKLASGHLRTLSAHIEDHPLSGLQRLLLRSTPWTLQQSAWPASGSPPTSARGRWRRGRSSTFAPQPQAPATSACRRCLTWQPGWHSMHLLQMRPQGRRALCTETIALITWSCTLSGWRSQRCLTGSWPPWATRCLTWRTIAW